jgi:sulfur relay (sulfurtransferase) complex TusBCD TusD component (DsrE family)
MRRGCISLGNIKCDQCHRNILYPERYLSLEQAKGHNLALCLNCCEEKGLLKTESEKAGTELLFNLSTD